MRVFTLTLSEVFHELSVEVFPLVLYEAARRMARSFVKVRQPPGLPRRLQRSTFGRPGLNRRVRDGNGCDPGTHRHRKSFEALTSEQ